MLSNYQSEIILQRQNAVQASSMSELSFESLDAALKDSTPKPDLSDSLVFDHIWNAGLQDDCKDIKRNVFRRGKFPFSTSHTPPTGGGRINECSLGRLGVSDSSSEAETEGELCHSLRPRIVWLSSLKNYSPDPIPFSGSCHPNESTKTSTPLSILQKLFTKQIMEFIVNSANKYASTLESNRGLNGWETLTLYDLWLYFGLVLFISLKNNSVVDDCWEDTIWGEPEVHRRISRKRYFDVDKSLHFWAEAPAEESTNSLSHKKLRTVFSMLTTNSMNLYEPSQRLSLDKSAISFEWKRELKKSLPQSKNRDSTEVYALVDLETDFYLNFIVVCGDSDCQFPRSKAFDGASLHERIVCELVSPYANRGHTLFLDGLYASPELCLFLKKEYQTDSLGVWKHCRSLFFNTPGKIGNRESTHSVIGEGLHCKVLVQRWTSKPGRTTTILST